MSYPVVKNWEKNLNAALEIALRVPSSVPGVSILQADAIHFVSMVLHGFLKHLNQLRVKNPNYVFLPIGKISTFLCNFCENSQPLQLQVWYEVFDHPSMIFFQTQFVLKEQEKYIHFLKEAIEFTKPL
jgi:hypothetical protein